MMRNRTTSGKEKVHKSDASVVAEVLVQGTIIEETEQEEDNTTSHQACADVIMENIDGWIVPTTLETSLDNRVQAVPTTDQEVEDTEEDATPMAVGDLVAIRIMGITININQRERIVVLTTAPITINRITINPKRNLLLW